MRSYEEIRGAFDIKVVWSTPTEIDINDSERRLFNILFCVNVRRMSLDGRDRNGDRHCNTSTTVEVV